MGSQTRYSSIYPNSGYSGASNMKRFMMFLALSLLATVCLAQLPLPVPGVPGSIPNPFPIHSANDQQSPGTVPHQVFQQFIDGLARDHPSIFASIRNKRSLPFRGLVPGSAGEAQ